MSRSVRIEQADGGAVVIAEALGREAVARLREKEARLRAAAHPGVIRVLSSEGDDDRWVLRTMHAGRPLDVGPRQSPEALAVVAAATATVLADLHEIGVVHGRLTAANVLIGAAGRPVLCGFGTSGDPGRSADPADDVAALGQIVIEHLAGGQTIEPIPDRRWRPRGRWSGWARATLLTLADQACADPPSRRPTARRLAAAISEAFDFADGRGTPVAAERSDDEVPPDATDPLGRLLRSVAELTAGPPGSRAWAVLAVAVVLAGALLLRPVGPSAETAPSTRPSVPEVQPTPHPAAPSEDRPAPGRPRRCPGSGCTDFGHVEVDGTLVTTEDGRFRVGRPGDIVVVADWDCDGRPTPAALRVSTGEVFVFPAWADDQELAVRALRTIPGAADLVAEDLDDGCSALQVRLADGGLVAVTGVAPS